MLVLSVCVCLPSVCVYQACAVYLEVDPAEASFLHCKVLGDLEEARSVALLLDGGSLIPILPRVALSPGTGGREKETERERENAWGAREREERSKREKEGGC